MMEDIIYWLALQQKRLLPTNVVLRFFNEYGTLERLWYANNYDLLKFGLSEQTIRLFFKFKKETRLQNFENLLETLKERNIRLIRYVDKEYPPLLKELTSIETIDGPPLVLFHKGVLLDFSKTIAVVGTRVCSLFGHTMARRLGRYFARNGYTVVSGLARGVDTEAHCGALEAPKGKTVAVLAWMSPIYPPENIELSKDIERKGAIISEQYSRSISKFKRFSPGKFVARNRITSGISYCVVVVETGETGGTIHQVEIALSQKKPVFVLKPPKSHRRAMIGFKLLLNKGAIPIESGRDVINYLEKNAKLYKDKRLDSYYQQLLSS